jgi:hypothetical protein
MINAKGSVKSSLVASLDQYLIRPARAEMSNVVTIYRPMGRHSLGRSKRMILEETENALRKYMARH